jgi:hypothetical protein
MPSDALSYIISLVIVITIVILIYYEYTEHDCGPKKRCLTADIVFSEEDTKEEQIDKLTRLSERNVDYVWWRRSLIVALIVIIPLSYFLNRRLPRIDEALVILLVVFLTTYFANSWFHFHYIQYNGNLTVEKLNQLKTLMTKNGRE